MYAHWLGKGLRSCITLTLLSFVEIKFLREHVSESDMQYLISVKYSDIF